LTSYGFVHFLLPFFSFLQRRPPISTLFPYTTLFRSSGWPPGDPRQLSSRPSRHRASLEPAVRSHAQFPGSRGWRTRTGPTNSGGDRKSTRLNSSHVEISYAVFCLKKKNNLS